MKIKRGDLVEIISGKEKGKKGKISLIIKKKNQVIIENINIKTKHIKPKQQNEKGYLKKIESPIHCSNIKLVTKTAKQ